MQRNNDLAAMRQARDVRQKELAAALGVSRVHLSYVEHGHRQSQTLVRRAVAFLSQRPAKK